MANISGERTEELERETTDQKFGKILSAFQIFGFSCDLKFYSSYLRYCRYQGLVQNTKVWFRISHYSFRNLKAIYNLWSLQVSVDAWQLSELVRAISLARFSEIVCLLSKTKKVTGPKSPSIKGIHSSFEGQEEELLLRQWSDKRIVSFANKTT